MGETVNSITNTLLSLIVSVVTTLLVSKYYGEHWVEIGRRRKEHSVALKDSFFKPWLDKITDGKDYCKIDAYFSKELGKMAALQPRDPSDLQFYDEAMSHLKDYGKLLDDWKDLKQTTLTFNEELAIFFEGIRIRTKKELDLQYWCSSYLNPQYSGDEPDEYLCPDSFIRAVYGETEWSSRRIENRFKESELWCNHQTEIRRFMTTAGATIVLLEASIKRLQTKLNNCSLNSLKMKEKVSRLSWISRKQHTRNHLIKLSKTYLK